MILFALVALIWVFNKDISNEVEVAMYEPPLPQEYTIINQASQDLATDEKTNTDSLRSPIWDTIENNKVALKKEILKALPHYANKTELFVVTNLLYRCEIPEHNKHASLVTNQNNTKSKSEQKIIEKLKENDRRLFDSILSYLKPAGDKAKEICDTYSYSNCDPYINVLVDLGNVYNIQQKYEDAIPYLETYQSNIKPSKMYDNIHTMISRVNRGDFTILWHNSSFNTEKWKKYQYVYEKIIKNMFYKGN